MQVEVTGRMHDYYEFKEGYMDPEDVHEGDILIQPKLDYEGRLAVKGLNANLGYSGYYAGFLFAEGGARRFLNWLDLWPISENTFRAQQDKGKARKNMQETLDRLSGSKMIKVRGGWQLERDANEILGRKG